ncbi:MAG TPA: hypothetical protein PKL96_10335 [Bacteroidales bacterium]|nr:hypothetical protein [Bacteroidales bacterium]HPS27974.1 hypothetical protein [Bacteroidales bacterium]
MKTKPRKLIIAVVAFFFCVSCFSSRSQAQFFTGGDMNIGILGGLNLNIAPIAGYRYKNFSVGVSPIIQYQATSTAGMAGQFSYGGAIFAEYSIWKGIFGHAEFHVTNSGYLQNSLGDIYKKGVWVMGCPIGIGYEHKISGNLWVKTMLLYDPFLDIDIGANSPQQNPSIRGGLTYVL